MAIVKKWQSKSAKKYISVIVNRKYVKDTKNPNFVQVTIFESDFWKGINNK